MANMQSRFLGVMLAAALQAAAAQAGGLPFPPTAPPPERGAGCGLTRSLRLCPAMPRPAAGDRDALLRTRRPDQPTYHRLQRLAGALADRMAAGYVGPVRLKLKVILE